MNEANSQWPADDGTNSSHPCFAIPTQNVPGVPATYTAPYVYVGKVMMFVHTSYAIPKITFTKAGDLTITQDTTATDSSYTVVDGQGNVAENDFAAHTVTAGQINTGNIFAKFGNFLNASISNLLSATGLNVAGDATVSGQLRLTNGLTLKPNQANDYTSFLDAAGAKMGSVNLHDGQGARFSSNNTTMAEYFRKANPSDTFTAGQVVCVDSSTGGVTACTDNKQIAGVVVDHAAFVGGDKHENDSNYVLVGVIGQLSINVATTSGTINPGDPITASAVAGIGEKAISAGQIIGHALMGTQTDGTITVAMNLGWYDPTFISGATSQGATGSAQLSGNFPLLTADTATIGGTLNVLGRTTLSDLGVTGDIQTGILAIHGLNGEINTIGDTLKLQSNALAGIDIENGAVTIDTAGNITTTGVLSATTVKTQSLDVQGSATIGSDTLPAGQTSVTISTSAMHTASKVFVTPTSVTTKQLIVTYKGNGSFTVTIPTADLSNITFDWWIVGNQ
jgi:hypothetical protein